MLIVMPCAKFNDIFMASCNKQLKNKISRWELYKLQIIKNDIRLYKKADVFPRFFILQSYWMFIYWIDDRTWMFLLNGNAWNEMFIFFFWWEVESNLKPEIIHVLWNFALSAVITSLTYFVLTCSILFAIYVLLNRSLEKGIEPDLCLSS